MFTRSFILLFVFAGFLACKRSNDAKPSEQGVETLHAQYFLSAPDAFTFTGGIVIGQGTILSPGGPSITQFKYTGGKVSRREGGYVPIVSTTGWQFQYSMDVFDKVEYFKDSIIITQDDVLPDMQMLPFRRKLILENGRLKTKIYYNVRSDNKNDTLEFSYGANGKVSKTEKFRQGVVEVKTFSYSAAGNLEKVTGRLYYRETPNVQYGETVETFEGYDGAANPLKNLWLWDDTFYRSISNNNFSKYLGVENYNGTNYSSASRNWTLKYDNNGRVLFDQ